MFDSAATQARRSFCCGAAAGEDCFSKSALFVCCFEVKTSPGSVSFNFSMSASSEDEYIENLSNEILGWCEDLVENGKLEFKQSECNQKFVIVMEGKVIRACELLCAKNKLQLDPTSRRIIVYKISGEVISMAQEKIAEKKASAAATARAQKKSAPKTTVAPPLEANVLKPIIESRKTKAVEPPATSAKKQKVVDTTGVKKISTYFAVQPKPPSAAAASDENTQPHVKSANSSVSSHASQHATQNTTKQQVLQNTQQPPPQNKPKLLLAVPKPMFIVDDYSPFKPEPQDEPFSPSSAAQSGVTLNEDLVNFVCQLIATESDRMDTLHVTALLEQMQHRADEVELRMVLSRLEGENKIMLDGDAIYVV